METDFLQVTESDSLQVTDITQFLSEIAVYNRGNPLVAKSSVSTQFVYIHFLPTVGSEPRMSR